MHSKKGFTLIELLVAMVIIVTLSAVLVPKYFSAKEQQRCNSVIADAHNLRSALGAYFSDLAHTDIPTVADLVADQNVHLINDPAGMAFQGTDIDTVVIRVSDITGKCGKGTYVLPMNGSTSGGDDDWDDGA